MDNREENVSGGRVTRSRIRRLSMESDSSSRPGTPIMQSSTKLPAINEITGSNTPTRPVRATRRNSATFSAVTELPKTPSKTPAKTRTALTRAITPEVDTPSKRTTRRRVSSITEEDSEAFKLTKLDPQFDVLKEEEDSTKVIKQEQHTPSSDEKQTNKRVTRSSSKSPDEILSTEQKSGGNLSKISESRRKSGIGSKVLDTINDAENKDSEVINSQSNAFNDTKREEKMGESVIEILDDTVQDEGMRVDALTDANDSNGLINPQSNSAKKLHVSVDTKVSENVNGDGKENEEKLLDNSKGNDEIVEVKKQHSPIINKSSNGTAVPKVPEIDIDLEKHSLELKQQIPQKGTNPIIAEESGEATNAIIDKISGSLNDINTTPTQNKRNFSGNFKSVLFNEILHEDTPKSIYPKTPAHTKTKSYIEIDSSSEDSNSLLKSGGNDSFQSSNASKNNLKDDSEEVIPETQQQAEAKEQIDKEASNANRTKSKVVDADAEKSELNKTPLKNLKKLQSVESSTPIANSTAQVKKPSQDLTPVHKVDVLNESPGDMSSSTEKSLRSGKSYTLTPNEKTKKNTSINNEKLEESKHQELVEKTDSSLVKKSLPESGGCSGDISLTKVGENKKENIFNQETWSEGVTGSVLKDSKIDDIAINAKSVKEDKVVEITEAKKDITSKRSSLSFLADNDEEQFSIRDDDDPAATEEEELTDGEKPYKKHAFVEDEAMEVDENYESGDSMDEEERKEMIDNEIPIDGESIGSKDTDDDYEEDELIDEGEDDEDNDKNSFIVSDSDEELLQYSDDDEHLDESKETKPREKKKFKRIVIDDSTTDIENEKKDKENKKEITLAESKSESEADQSSSNKSKNTKSSQVQGAVSDGLKSVKEIEDNHAADTLTETLKDIVTDEFISELEKDVSSIVTPPMKKSTAERKSVENVKNVSIQKSETNKSPDEQFAPSLEHSSIDSDVSKLSESALKLCYTAGDEPTEESENETNLSQLNASRKDILRTFNKSECFNKTNHELDVENFETSTEIDQLSVNTEHSAAKAKRKSLNRSKVEAIREAQISSDDDDDDNQMNENNNKGKRKSPNRSKMQNLHDSSKNTNTDESTNDTNKFKNGSLSLDSCGKQGKREKETDISIKQTSQIKKKTNDIENEEDSCENNSAKPVVKKSMRKSFNENQLLGKSAEKSATLLFKSSRKSLHESNLPHKSTFKVEDLKSETTKSIKNKRNTLNGDNTKEDSVPQVTVQRKSLNKPTLTAKETPKRTSLYKNEDIKLQVESCDEEVDPNTTDRSGDENKSVFPTVSHLGDVSVTDSDENKSEVDGSMTDEARYKDKEKVKPTDVSKKIKKTKSAGLSLSFGECLQTKKQTNKGKTVLHNSYTIGVSVYENPNTKKEAEDDKHEANAETQSFDKFTTDFDMEDVEDTTNDEETVNKSKTTDVKVPPQSSRKNQLNSDEEQELKKLDHIQKLFNPLSKTRRQSLALPHNELTGHKQLKRSKRQSLNMPSAEDFNPSQSLIDTIAMRKNVAVDSPKAQNPKRKRLSKSFNGVGTLDTTELEEGAHHLHKKTKLTINESDETDQQVDDNTLHTSAMMNKPTQMISSTPCLKKSNQEINNNVKRILSRCDQILEAASLAKLESKQNFLKSKVKLVKKSKKSGTKTAQQTELASNEDINNVATTSPSDELKKHEKVSVAVKKAVMASAKILHVTDKQSKEMDLIKKIEVKNEKRRLPVDVIEAISSNVQQQSGVGAAKNVKKIKKQSSKSNQENVEHIQKSSAGYIIETPLTPKKVKKQKPIETINLPTGKMNVLPATPKKQFINGFQETQATPQTIGFKVRQILNNGQDIPPAMLVGKNKKRKRQQLVEEPEYSLPQPKWTQSGQFIEEGLSIQRPYQLLAQHKTAGTDFMFASLEQDNKRNARKIKKVTRSKDLYDGTPVTAINQNALNFKNTATRGNVPREPTRALLHRKERYLVNNKF